MGDAYMSGVGVSCLISAITLSRGLRLLMCAQRGCASLAESCLSHDFSQTFGV